MLVAPVSPNLISSICTYLRFIKQLKRLLITIFKYKLRQLLVNCTIFMRILHIQNTSQLKHRMQFSILCILVATTVLFMNSEANTAAIYSKARLIKRQSLNPYRWFTGESQSKQLSEQKNNVPSSNTNVKQPPKSQFLKDLDDVKFFNLIFNVLHD